MFRRDSRQTDSASDNAASARDYNNQAIFGVQRPANLFDEETERLDRQAVNAFNAILDYIGIQPGKKCNPDDCKVERILAMTDGDVDGDSIAITIFGLFAKHCKPMIDAGMIGRILPPFYSYPVSKNKREYVRSQREFVDMVMSDFCKNVTVSHKIRGKLSKKDLYHLLTTNFDYTTKIERLYKWCYCPEKFIEYIAYHYDSTMTEQTVPYWKKQLKPFPELKVYKDKDGTVVVDGSIKDDYIFLAFDKKFHNLIMQFKSYQSLNDYITGYIINDEPDKTLYDVMHKFDKYKPKNIKRFKGLGELSEEEMRRLCMDPKTRDVIILKYKNIDTDLRNIAMILSTRAEFTRMRSEMLRSMTADDMDIDT